MITKTVYLYEFKELSEAAQKEVKQWYLDDPCRSEQLTEDFVEDFLKYFFPNSNLYVQWCLSYCQGDGVNIYGELDLADVLNYIEKWNSEEHGTSYAYDPRAELSPKEIRRLRFYIKSYQNSTTCVQRPMNRRYTYCIADQLEFAQDVIEDLEYGNVRDIDSKLIFKFEKACVQIIENLCGEMDEYGYKFLYEVDDEEVEEVCEANGWYFTASGKFETA